MSQKDNLLVFAQTVAADIKTLITGAAAQTYSTYQINASGRVYLYDDARWVTNADDNYGVAYYQWAESGTTSANPVLEWEHKGDFVRQGTLLHSLDIYGRVLDATTIADLEIAVYYTNNNGKWDATSGTGLDADGEDTHTELWRGFWIAGGTGVPAKAIPINDEQHIKIPLGDFNVPADGDVRIYFRPINVDPRPNTSTDYAQMVTSYLFSIADKIY